MEKPPYEYDSLKEAVEKREMNIEAFRQAIRKEEEYKAELLGYVKLHEIYMKEQQQ